MQTALITSLDASVLSDGLVIVTWQELAGDGTTALFVCKTDVDFLSCTVDNIVVVYSQDSGVSNTQEQDAEGDIFGVAYSQVCGAVGGDACRGVGAGGSW
jgi:hypothetical protein